MADDWLKLRMVVHGDPKTGKSSFAETAIGPRLIVDAEGGTDFGAKPIVRWTDAAQPPPVPENPDTSVVLFARDWNQVTLAHQWLSSGQHPFRSYVMDSITEVQARAKKAISTTGMDQRAWGELLDRMMAEMTMVRDLTKHPTNPLSTIVIVAHSDRDEKTGILRPMVQGALRKHLGGLFDVIAHLRVGLDAGTGRPGRELVIDALPGIEAGDRTKVLRRRFGSMIQLHLDDETDRITPDLTDLLKILNGEQL